ncbi:winged helix-turn-helix domain-containing protein [Thalassomonas viridans]|uniref:Winged helix-turn-helix domain-containing protein n=1 Tax=Thalassomonas viridans TaxID=137584 RepID=A0AAF0C8Q8_9GAMM|nr:winged helix-turn-helix domain-containing protein [Thalassomonas viridans]WDE06702.1 winged helix-turn-helix domain-containing protein [Thalassomonas viridans]
MRYQFKDFEFNSASLVLSQNGETVDIRHNEAKLLALLLERSDEVLSKEEILSRVWQDKVVSEQAVFQNISHLRNLFGNQAIKTFPKRGYQWQLETEPVSSVPQTNSNPAPAQPQTTVAAAAPKRPYWLYAVLSAIVLLSIAIMSWPEKPAEDSAVPAIKMAYIPLPDAQDNTDIALADNSHFDFTALTELETDYFEASAELEYPVLKDRHPFVLTGHTRTHDSQVYLDFLLKGPFGEWQGQISAPSKKHAVEQLQQHLKQPFIYDFLSAAQPPELKQANLLIAHQQAPEDLITLARLITTYTDTGEFEKAMVMADKLANIAQSQNNVQHTGNAYLYQSRILTRKELFELSAQKLALAIEQFEQIGDLKRLADAWHAQSWLDHQQEDYPAIKASLLKAAQLAFTAGDKARELDALTYLSIMAHKHHRETDKYLYLQQAENKMKAYQLPVYHFSKVPFHYAIFATKPADKEPHLKQVLEFSALTPDHWVAQSSRKQLVQNYIAQDRLTEAQALIDSQQTDNAHNSYLKTLLAQARQQTHAFISQAQRTFEQAHLAGQQSLSLDAALLLCSAPNSGESSPQINYDFYWQYINDNAPPYWRRANKNKLLALNL